MYKDHPDNILGVNSADNQFVSSAVVANADGSIIERLESIQQHVGAVDAADNPIGANNANNGFDSSAVVANANGSVLERLEGIKDDIAAISVVDTSAEVAAIQTDLGDPSARTNLQSILALLGNPDAANQSLWNALAVAGGIATYPVAAVPGNGAALAQVLRDIWDSLRNGTGGTEPGTNRSIIDEIKGAALNYNAVNYLAVTADMTSGTWNTVATHELFTVTGLVRMRILAEVAGDCGSGGGAATIKLGHEAASGDWIAATGEDDLDVGEVWFDATPTEKAGAFASLVLDKVVSGVDVGYEIEGEAFNAGSIVFHCWWEPLNSTGAVVAGAGGVLV